MKRTLQETFAEARRFILEHCPEGTTDWCRSSISQTIANDPLSCSFIDVQIDRVDCEGRTVTVNISFDADYVGKATDKTTGVVYHELRPVVKVNLPAFGTITVAQARARVDLLQDCIAFATELEQRFSHTVYHRIDEDG